MANSYASISHVDRQITNLTTGVTSAYSAPTTTWTIPYTVNTDQVTQGHLTISRTDTATWFEDAAQAVNAGVTVTRPANNKIAVSGAGNLTAVPVLIGVLFNASWELSTIYERDQNKQAEQRGRLRLGYFHFAYEPMTNLTATVTPQGRSPYVYVFYDPTAGAGMDEVKPFTIPIQARNEDSTIVFSDSTPGSFRIVSYDWEGTLTMRARGV